MSATSRPRLWAISDLHLASEVNRTALADIPDHGDDWLILGGDIAEREEVLVDALDVLGRRFGTLIWVPGNHDLWTDRRPGAVARRGDARYSHLVELARAAGAVTPEDPFPRWPADLKGAPVYVVPLFLLYDYSFRPDGLPLDEMKDWVRQKHAVPVDELLLDPAPFASRAEWCAARCAQAEARLSCLPPDAKTVLINHWPMREDLIRIPRVPRFLPWCGTRRTHDWHRRYRALEVVTGHLHTRRTDFIDGTRFHEVSLGYPRQWDQDKGIAAYLKDVTPQTRGG
ncbi:metallophosphoesterase [Nisaea acidiphila]|uniref:Metallophosphoesterase n=1 Tax=Nisaea acidiphila TaxID=1862145 RepID=A0A9J7AWA0_9PROT|nr:metallophosphoesterase [Nisaea acidiphila]UUX51631.1 metallophosphoesterase [Nisaea acidiphila]